MAAALLARGEAVVGVDNLNDYYDVALKQARLQRLRTLPGFCFRRLDISDRDAMFGLIELQTPALIGSCICGSGRGAAFARRPLRLCPGECHGPSGRAGGGAPALRPEAPVYASTSSVYGANRVLPFSETDRVDTPLSVYAATKRADELMSHAYAHLYALPQTGLRFFTVYGPWGRPDMAYYSFARAIAAGEPITVYDGGRLRRDFTYIDDIVAGVLGCLDGPPAAAAGPAPEYRQSSERTGLDAHRASGAGAWAPGHHSGHPEAARRCRGDLRLCRGDRRPDRLRPGNAACRRHFPLRGLVQGLAPN